MKGRNIPAKLVGMGEFTVEDTPEAKLLSFFIFYCFNTKNTEKGKSERKGRTMMSFWNTAELF
jgi:hypothetical protein